MNFVEAVKTQSQRDQVEAHLHEAGRIYYDVWKVGINLALRISDLLSITMDQITHMDPDVRVLEIEEQKTGKHRRLVFNNTAYVIVQQRLAEYPKAKYLFQSEATNIDQRKQQPISRRSVARVFEKVGQKIAPKVQLGTHSMRKTRGYAMHEAGRPIEQICKVLNQSSPAVTMRYIGIDQRDIDRSYVEFEL